MTSAEEPPHSQPGDAQMLAVSPSPVQQRGPDVQKTRTRRGGGAGRTQFAVAGQFEDGTMEGVEGGEMPLQGVEIVCREFKTQPCGRDGPAAAHDHRCCPFYHSERDRRRMVFAGAPGTAGESTICYTAEPCSHQFDDKRGCPQGDLCGLCHSTAELLYHPEFFRKRLCHQAKRCPRGRLCAFAHSRADLLVPHFSEEEENDPTDEFIAYNFKTQWCPIGGPHDWESCVYAHTYRDWRRTPLIGYSSWPCPQWSKSVAQGPTETAYQDRCPHGMACPLAHGAKEQLYHPNFYKTSPCSEANCKRGVLCAFTHGDFDTRHPDVEQENNLERPPIANVQELLSRFQPTFWQPPRYHALEDNLLDFKGGKGGARATKALTNQLRGVSGKSATSGKGQGHNRGLAGKGSLQPPPKSGQRRRQQMESFSFNGSAHSRAGPPGTFFDAASAAPATPYFYQWVPCGDVGGQLLPPSMGYVEGPQHGMAAWPSYVDSFCPAGPSLVWNHTIPTTDMATCPGSMNYGEDAYSMANCMPLHGSSMAGRFNYRGPLNGHDGLHRKNKSSRWLKEQFKDGLRTPSSLGSAVMSTGTDGSDEKKLSSQDGLGDSNSEDTLLAKEAFGRCLPDAILFQQGLAL